MSRIIAQVETVPASYPAIEDLEESDALSAAWQRIEHYIAWRYSPRSVVWRIESTGCEWRAPLAPVVTLTAQVDGDDPFEPEAGPQGGWMLPRGIVTVTATVGAGPAPAAVLEAVRRYVRLMTTTLTLPAGVTRFSSGTFDAAVRRDELNPAMAMVNSGAADLLRAYRRV